jgi:hypothetical protein
MQSPSLHCERESFSNSKLHTEATTHLENFSFEGQHIDHAQEVDTTNGELTAQSVDNSLDPSLQRAQVARREQSNGFLFDKLNDLEEKSSKLLTRFPDIHSKILRTQSQSVSPFDFNFFAGSSGLYGNKLRIIRDLEEKITHLEDNINNPTLGQEYVRTIEKEINLNFEHYYNEIKENGPELEDQNKSLSSEDSFESERANRLADNPRREF